MPNLKQVLRFKSKYENDIAELTPSKIDQLLEGFDPNRIEKSFNVTGIEDKTFSFVNNFIARYSTFFEERKKVNAVLLYVDITSFSTQFATKSAEHIAEYLDTYYNHALPIIGRHGGVVEKIMWDGIICLFGEPFLSLAEKELHRRAEKCAIELIKTFKGPTHEIKIAFHYGEIMYYQNESSEYWEYTMIGNALTELFRLESVSFPNSINFYCGTFYDSLNQSDASGHNPAVPAQWTLSYENEVELNGVSYSHIRYLEKI